MLNINASHYVNVHGIIEDFQRRSGQLSFTALPSDSEFNELMAMVTNLRGMCDYMRMAVSVVTLDRIIKEYSMTRPSNASVRQRLDQWYSCFTAEIESQLLLIVLPHRHAYYSEAIRGDGTAIAGLIASLDLFPSAVYDAREAENCFAFERFTACVFHLMRCAEFGLVSVARSALVPEDKINKGWDGCIRGIESHVKVIGSTRPTSWQDDVKKYSDLSSWFTSIQKGWRNSVSHVPRTYSEDTAGGIFSATRTLFEHLKNYGFGEVEMPHSPIIAPEDL